MARPNILVTRSIPDEAKRLLAKHCDIEQYDKHAAIPRPLFLKMLKDKDGLLCILTEKVNQETLDAAPRLKAVATYSVGYDHIDVKACGARKIAVMNTPGVLTETTADFAWSLLMAAARRVVEGDRFMRAGKYKAWDPMMLLGCDVFGKTIGIVGFGRIGQAVARRAAGFGMKIIYFDAQRIFPEVEREFGVHFRELKDLLREADFITLHCVLDAATHHLIDEDALSLMKPSAVLVNTARGPIVDERALVKALKSKRIAAAGLDVYELEPKMASGLSKLSNVVLAPHLASASLETRTKMGVMAAQGLIDVLANKKMPAHPVNPEVCQVLLAEA